MKNNTVDRLKTSTKVLAVAALTVSGLSAGWLLLGKDSVDTKNTNKTGAIAQSETREISAQAAIRDYQAWRIKHQPLEDKAADGPASRLTTTEARYFEALSWISKKALKSDTELTDYKAAWADPAFSNSLARGLNSHEMSNESEMPISMLTTALLVSAINDPSTLEAAEKVVLQHLKEVRIEDLQQSQSHTTGSNGNSKIVSNVAENQAELLFHWSAQAKNAESKLRDLERVSPSPARLAILKNVEREHRNNLSMSSLELKAGQ